MKKSARKKRIKAAPQDTKTGKVKPEGYKPARQIFLTLDGIKNYFLTGNEISITYQKGGEHYRHVFNKNVQCIYPEGKHFLILYDPAGRMTWKKSRGIMG